MMNMLKYPVITSVLLLSLLNGLAAEDIDSDTGLIIDDNFELVKRNCTICHSANNIIQQGGSRLTWLGLIRWMQDTQGLRSFDVDTESKILDYLETNYGVKEGDNERRGVLPADLLPPNPYQTQATVRFASLQERYQGGDSIHLELVVENFPSYSQGRFDLWLAIQVPDVAELYFVSGTPTAPSFNNEAQVFIPSLDSVDNRHLLLQNLQLPPIVIEGEYVFYALLVEEGANPLLEIDITRSNLAVQAIVLGQ